jgi:YVTN family beta-propeller protein
VVNGTAETLSIIDLNSGTVENDAVVLGDIPNELEMWDNTLFVVNSGSNNLQVIDPDSRTTLATIELGPDNNPYDLEIAPSGLAYVSNFVSNVVYVVDLNTRAVVDTIPVGLSPEGLLLVDDELYVCNTAFDPVTYGYGPGTVSVIDINTNTVVDTIAVGTNPQSLALGADSLVHVVATGNFATIPGAVYVIDPDTRTVVDTVEIGGQPNSISVSADGTGYLAAGGWVDKGFVLSYDTRTHQVLRGESDPIIAPTGVLDVATGGDSTLYVASFSADEVAHLDRAGSVLATWGVGDGPSSILIDERTPSDVANREATEELPSRFVLHQNYPNPVIADRAGSQTRISLDLLAPSSVELVVFDRLGREVAKVFHGALPAGRHGFLFDAAGLPSGVYFYRLRSGSFSALRRMTVVQ